jgi:hypothetical protein
MTTSVHFSNMGDKKMNTIAEVSHNLLIIDSTESEYLQLDLGAALADDVTACCCTTCSCCC